MPIWLAAPMQYEPGEKWKYTQSGINAAARIVEVVSGQTFDAFLQHRLFDPLGMKSTTFYPGDDHRARLVTAYAKDKDTGGLTPVPRALSTARATGRRRAMADFTLLRSITAASARCSSTGAHSKAAVI